MRERDFTFAALVGLAMRLAVSANSAAAEKGSAAHRQGEIAETEPFTLTLN